MGYGACRFQFADTGRRPQVVTDAIGSAEAGQRDDFLVIDSFAPKTAFAGVNDVPLTR